MRISLGSAFLVVGVVAGYISAQQSLGRSGVKPVAEDPRWMQAGVSPKDPYAIYSIGHFIVDGFLPPPTSAQIYVRKVDDDGNSLRSDCTYTLVGAAPQSRWWVVKIGNATQSINTLSARDAILSGTDQLQINIARLQTAGNWLAMPQVNAPELSLVMNEPYPLAKNTKPLPLPSLKKVECE